jgi:hypothetical protein
MISDAWKKAEEIKKEKERLQKKTVLKASTTSTKLHNKENEGSNAGEELQSILDAAWVNTRDKVFKKKRNSLIQKSITPRGGD